MTSLLRSLLTPANLAAYVTVGAVGVISFISVPDPNQRWWVVGFLLGFFALMLVREASQVPFPVYLLGQTALSVGLMSLQPNGYAAPILFFVLSAQVATVYTGWRVVAWLVVFGLVALANSVMLFGWAGLAVTLPYWGGYLFFASFGQITRNAQTARAESQRLLEDLRTAHTQLQAYAAQAEQLAVAEERNRLARELHDSLGHRLTVAVVQLEGAQRLIPTDPERAARMIGTMRDQMKEALRDLRTTLSALHAPLAETVPLEAALIHLTRIFQEAAGLPVHLNLPPDLPPLPANHRLALYRAAQETLTNAHKHAHAHAVWMQLFTHANHITLETRDDGVGLPAEPTTGGTGLAGLRHRAAELGGHLHCGPAPEGGACLQFTLPYPT